MTTAAADPQKTSNWLGFLLSALPLLILLILFAFGTPIAFWIYILVLAWCVLMPLWIEHDKERAASREGRQAAPAGRELPMASSSRALVDPAGNAELAGRIANIVSPDVFAFTGWEVQPAGLVLRGALRAPAEAVQRSVAAAATPLIGRSPQVMVHEGPDHRPYVLIPNADLENSLAASVPRRRPWINLALLLLTLLTTTLAGAAHHGINLLRNPGAWASGLPYALGVMLILGVHEMGHYVAARRHGVQVSLPYFIPIPFGLGTFGAFISMPALLKNRRQLFDIGVAGPLAGLAAAIPALIIGLRWSTVLPAAEAAATGQMGSMGHGVSVNSSVLLTLLSKLAIGDRLAQGHYLVLHPLAFAGWLGLMITALNLLPVGQLDGGHVSHALLGRARADWLGKVALFGMVLLGLFVWSGLLFWALVVYFIAGTRGIPPLDDVTPLDAKRRAIAWLALALLVLILLPVPQSLSAALGLHNPYL